MDKSNEACAVANRGNETRQYTLRAMARYWQNLLRPFHRLPHSRQWPLDSPSMLSRTEDPTRNAYTGVPWQLLLAGADDYQPVLDFAASEAEFLHAPASQGLTITRSWDVDSFMFRIPTLNTHRHGFRLAYKPPFLRRVTQNPKVAFKDHAIDQLKQLRIGRGVAAAGFGYDTHVFFPNCPVRETTHLTDSEQEAWIDHVVLPALRLSCPSHVVQHHPRSFADANAKAHVRAERFDEGSYQAMDIAYTVPAEHLGAFSDALTANANTNTHPEVAKFQGLFFVVSGHDQKLHTGAANPSVCRQRFLEQLRLAFNCDFSTLEDCWLDFGIEDTPQVTPGQAPVTLLRKTTCLTHWLKCFRCPNPDTNRQHLTPSRYQWGATAMAGTASVKMDRPGNWWHQKGLFAYHKAYNLHKDIFATPLKDYAIFDQGGFEALALGQDLLTQWGTANSRRGRQVSGQKRQGLIKAYLRSKERLSVAFRDSQTTSFGARQEYRLTFNLFQALDLDDETEYPAPLEYQAAASRVPDDDDHNGNDSSDNSMVDNPAAGVERQSASVSAAVGVDRAGRRSRPRHLPETHHFPYWILPTQETNDFAAAQMNRWLLVIEFLADSAEARTDAAAVPNESQLLNSLLCAAAVRMLRFSTCSFVPNSRRDIWKDFWLTNPTPPQGDGSDSDPNEEDVVAPTRNHRRARWGLNAQSSLQRSGIPWLPQGSCLWTVPAFTHEWSRRVDMADNAVGAGLTRTTNIHAKLVSADYSLRYIEHLVLRAIEDDDTEHGYSERDCQVRPAATLKPYFHTLAQIVIMHYIRQVWATLYARVPQPRSKDPARREEHRRDFFRFLHPRELNGTAGLTPNMVSHVLGFRPRAVAARLGGARNGQLHFPQHNTIYWKDRVHPLFAVGEETLTKRRAWDNLPYRVLARHIHAILERYTSRVFADLFGPYLCSKAAQYLWIIPQWNIDHFSILRKPSKHHAASTQAEISEMTELQRTQWLCPAVPERLCSHVIELRHYDLGTSIVPRVRSQAQARQALKNHFRSVGLSEREVYHDRYKAPDRDVIIVDPMNDVGYYNFLLDEAEQYLRHIERAESQRTDLNAEAFDNTIDTTPEELSDYDWHGRRYITDNDSGDE